MINRNLLKLCYNKFSSGLFITVLMVAFTFLANGANAQIKVIEVVEIEGFASFVYDEYPALVTANGDIVVSLKAADLTFMDVASELKEKLKNIPSDKKADFLKSPRNIKRYVVGNSVQELGDACIDESMSFAVFKGVSLPGVKAVDFEQFSGLNGLTVKTVSKGNDFTSSKKLNFRKTDVFDLNLNFSTANGVTYLKDAAGISDGAIVNQCGEVLGLFHSLDHSSEGYRIYTAKDFEKLTCSGFNGGISFKLADSECDKNDVKIPVDPDPIVQNPNPTPNPVTSPNPGPVNNPNHKRRGNKKNNNPPANSNTHGSSAQLDSILNQMVLESDSVQLEVENLSVKVEDSERKIESYLIVICAVVFIGFIGLAMFFRRKKVGQIKSKVTKKEKTNTPTKATMYDSAPLLRGVLTDNSGVFGGKEFMIQGTFTVGRGDGSVLKFPSSIKEVSRNHAILTIEGGFVIVSDLGSSNGTMVNDETIKPNTKIRLQIGDKVSFGKKRYGFTIE
jgi:hypothetical protein